MTERQSRAQRDEPEPSPARFSFAEWSLRRKLAALAATVRIETVRGIGYRLVEGGLS